MKLSLKGARVNAWKEKFKKMIFSHWPEKKEKIRGVIIGSGLTGTVISLKMVIAIGTSVIKVKAKNLERIWWKF